MLSIKVTGLDKIRNGLGADYPRAIHIAAEAIGEEVKLFMKSDWPPPTAKRIIQRAHGTVMAWYQRKEGSAWTTLKGQTHWNKSSKNLKGSWATVSTPNTVIIGSNAPYAPWVQAHDMQTAQHKAQGWRTDKQAIEHVVRTGIVKRELTEAIRKAFGGRT